MRKCASGGQSLANGERGVGMSGFVGKIDTEFFITNVLLCINMGEIRSKHINCAFSNAISFISMSLDAIFLFLLCTKFTHVHVQNHPVCGKLFQSFLKG